MDAFRTTVHTFSVIVTLVASKIGNFITVGTDVDTFCTCVYCSKSFVFSQKVGGSRENCN
jgi:hypothetical protein